MKDITIIVPINEVNKKSLIYIKKALASVKENQKYYNNKLRMLLICLNDKDKNVLNENLSDYEFDIIVNNTDKTDYCSQINIAVKLIDTEYSQFLNMMMNIHQNGLKWHQIIFILMKM